MNFPEGYEVVWQYKVNSFSKNHAQILSYCKTVVPVRFKYNVRSGCCSNVRVITSTIYFSRLSKQDLRFQTTVSPPQKAELIAHSYPDEFSLHS